VYISNDMHFIKIVVDLITLYYLSTNFMNNPHINMLEKRKEYNSFFQSETFEFYLFLSGSNYRLTFT